MSPAFLAWVYILEVLAGCFIQLSGGIFVVRLRGNFLRRVGASIALSLAALLWVRNGATIISVDLTNVLEMRTPNGYSAQSRDSMLLLYGCTRKCMAC